jgi:2-polyprenyl-3-methyl-5-hydroxy-6-metoxy-1,4-benzoquinol methylase
MGSDVGQKTEQAHWDTGWQPSIRMRLPSRLNVDVLNLTRLLIRHVNPGSRYLEVGCAPGKLLAWVAAVLKAETWGIDYSDTGIAHCRALCDALKLKVELRHDDFFDHHLPYGSYDVVSSFGFAEHFDNVAPVVQRHLDLVKPGGIALITIPNFDGLYGRLQRWCDPALLALHNLDIMNAHALELLVQSRDAQSVRAYRSGNVSAWRFTLDRKVPKSVARAVWLGVNAFGLLQPATIGFLAPLLVLEVTKKGFP